MLTDQQILAMIEVQEKKAKKVSELKETLWQFIEANEEPYVAEVLISHLKNLLECHKSNEPYPSESMDMLMKDVQETREKIKENALEYFMKALSAYFAIKAELVLQMWLTLGAPNTEK